MSTQLVWRPHALVSALHAAHALSRGAALADPRVAEALQPPAAALDAELRAAQLPLDRFWGHLLPLAASLAHRRQLIETALVKTVGRGGRFEAAVAQIDAPLAALEAAARTAWPGGPAELALRERPLREQWEARGPGLLKQVALLTDPALVPAEATVLLVQPALGGGGAAHLAYNSVRIEAVLANPVAELPEVARLAWLLAQLQLDLPAYSETIHADRLPHIARYAMLPVILNAAEAVELTQFTPALVQTAIQAWRLVVPRDLDAAAVVNQWWQAYLETRPAWPIALAALDRMLG